MLEGLDPVCLSPHRLLILTILRRHGEVEFVFLKNTLRMPAGNLSQHLKTLEKAGYVLLKKSIKNKYPVTTCSISDSGLQAFEGLVAAIKRLEEW
ncbi:MAG: transcriptional regulator [Ferruginibacter sp.]